MAPVSRLRPGFVGALALATALASASPAGLPRQAILLEPGSVNASVSADAWWLANGSVVFTWSTAEGKFSLASIYDRLGGRPVPRTGEAFMLVLADGRVVRGSDMRLAGAPSVEPLPPQTGDRTPVGLLPGKQIVARFETPDGAITVTWRGTLREQADYVRQHVTIDAFPPGQPPEALILVDAQDAGARLAAPVPGSPVTARGSFLAIEHPASRCEVDAARIRCTVSAAALAGQSGPIAASAVIGLMSPSALESALAAHTDGTALLDALLRPERVRTETPKPVRVLAGPYLQAPGPASMTIVWVTDGPSAGWVEYGPDERLGSEALPTSDGLVDADTTVHRVTISDLEPGRQYFYRAVSRSIESVGPYKVDFGSIARSDVEVFRTLDPARGDYSFLVMNDLHEDVETMRRHAERAATEPYDLVFFNGDSLSHLESEAQILERCLLPASELFANRIPLVFVRGNHETRGRFARKLGHYLGLPDDRYYYSFAHGPVHFVVMDTGEDKEDGHWAYSGLTRFDEYRQAQAEWLAKEVESPAFRNASFRVLVAHMPFFGNQGTRVDGHGQRDARERWGDLLNEAGLDLHIAGHTHRANWVEAGSGPSRFPIVVGGGSQRGSNTLIRVRVSPDRLDITLATDEGKEVGRHRVVRRQK